MALMISRGCLYAAWFYILAITGFIGYIPGVGGLPEIGSICPYTDFCTVNSTLNVSSESGLEPCCAQCSCAQDCHLVGTCCPDKQDEESDLTEYHCVSLSSVLDSPREFYEYNNIEQHFYIVDACPDKLIGLNFSGCENPQVLEDFVIVSDNERVYKNRHCAHCHGVTAFNEWELTTECSQVMTRKFQTFAERDRFIFLFCNLNARPPNDNIRLKSACFPDYELISNCPANEKKVDKSVRRQCRRKLSFENTVVRKGSKVYSNYFCYLCNHPDEPNAGLCPIPEEDPTKLGKVTFSGSIRKAREMRHAGNSRCRGTEVWDSVMGVCRNLHCPLGTIPVDGICEESMVYTEGLSFFLLFEVVFSDPDPALSLTENRLQDLEAYVLQIIDGMSECGICTPDVLQSQSRVFVRLYLYTKKSCTVSFLAKTAKEILKRNENEKLASSYHSQRGDRNFTLTFTTETIPSTGGIEHLFSIGQNCSSPAIQIDLLILHDCPSFLVPLEILLGLDEKRHSTLDPSALVSVCVETVSGRSAAQVSLGVTLYPNKLLVLLLMFLLANLM